MDTILSAPSTPSTLTCLSELAERVNHHHHQLCTDAANNTLDHAHAADDTLLQAKEQSPHGEFQDWLRDNFQGSARTARLYMQISRNWQALEGKRQRAATLSLRQAAGLISPPKPTSPPADDLAEVTTQVDAGFLAAIPELSPDTIMFALGPGNDNYVVEVHPAIAHPDYYHVLFYRDLDTDNAEVFYDRRGAKLDRRLLAYILQYIHGVKPTCWRSEPATGKAPWCVEADKTSRPGRVYGA